MNKITVSVIIPVYNNARYVADCVQSVLAQTYPHFEVLCIEDGSTDNSLQIIQKMAQADGRIRVLQQPHSGPGRTRNLGLQEAKGTYVMFVDADDLLHPACLQTALDVAQKYKADLVAWKYMPFTTSISFVPLGSAQSGQVHLTKEPILLGSAWMHYVVWGKLYKKTLLDGISFENEYVFEDLPFIYAVMLRHPSTAWLEAPLYAYRNAPGSLSNQTFQVAHIEACHRAISKILRLYAQADARYQQMIRRDFLPRILKNQLYRCRHATPIQRPDMVGAFAKELKELKGAGWLTWQGHRFDRYIWYQYLIWKHTVVVRSKK